MKTALFDLDGTLADPGSMVPADVTTTLQGFEAAGVQLVLCSGKPTYYLAGLARQLGLHDVALIGETGFAVQVGTELPPRAYHEMASPEGLAAFYRDLRHKIAQTGWRVWYQPNAGSLTVFYYDDATRDALEDLLRQEAATRDDVTLFRQPDCFDLTPGTTKADGIRWFLDYCQSSVEDAVYVGDGENDQPAFDLVPESIAIDPHRLLRARHRVDDLSSALSLVETFVGRP